ncbi:MAG: hypothetical protein KZQ77_09430 [Candidatus Thiodiazotropha sp. (ex Notomyrtea botanica)]|nr:hypothetical protein [Candidatus Thiodiazotropha sp. (ex Notomyrtea botanica)]
MFGYLERQSEKRLYFSYLIKYGLTQDDLGEPATQSILSQVYENSQKLSKRFHEPVTRISRSVVVSAAWASIYALLGPRKLIEIDPDNQEFIDEIETELVCAGQGVSETFNVYQHVFQTLLRHGRCHQEVVEILNRNSLFFVENSPKSIQHNVIYSS